MNAPLADRKRAFLALGDLCRGGQLVTVADIMARERNVYRGHVTAQDEDWCVSLRIIAAWLGEGAVCTCGSDDVAKVGLAEFPRECGACGRTIYVAPDGEPHYVSPRTMRKAQAAFDSVPDEFGTMGADA